MAATETTFNSKMLCRFNNKSYTYKDSNIVLKNQITNSKFGNIIFKGAEIINDGIKISGTRNQSEGILVNNVGNYSNYTIYLAVSSTDPRILELPNSLAITSKNNMYAISKDKTFSNIFISSYLLDNKVVIAVSVSNGHCKVYFNGSLQYKYDNAKRLSIGNILFGSSLSQLNANGDIIYYDFAIAYEAQDNTTVSDNSKYLLKLYEDAETVGGGNYTAVAAGSSSSSTGIIGENGKDGEDGFSPIVNVQRNNANNGVTISITDANGTTAADVMDGTIGETGATGLAGENGFTPTIEAIRNVNNNGYDITITNKTGSQIISIYDGQNGFSPSASVERNINDNGATITVTDKEGTTTADVMDGFGTGTEPDIDSISLSDLEEMWNN